MDVNDLTHGLSLATSPLQENHRKTEACCAATLHTTACCARVGNIASVLVDSFGIFNDLPIEPQDASTFTEAISLTQSSKEKSLYAPINSLHIMEIDEFADPSGPFAFYITSSQPNVCWDAVRRNLLLIGALADDTVPAVSLRSSTIFEVRPTANRVRVSISPSWWSGATTFTLVGLYHAGHYVQMPTLPASVAVVRVNHAPSSHGRLWKAAHDGDTAEVIAAIKDGCSTEETDDQVRCILCTHSFCTWHSTLDFLDLLFVGWNSSVSVVCCWL